MEGDYGDVGDAGSSGDVGGFGDYGGADYGGHAGDGVGEVGSVSDGGSAGSIADTAPAGVYSEGVMADEFGGFDSKGQGFFGVGVTDADIAGPNIAANFSAKGFATAALAGAPGLASYAARGLVGALVDGVTAAFSTSSAAPGYNTTGSAANYGGGGDVYSTSAPSGGGVVYGVGGSPVIGYTQPKPAPLVSPVYTKTAAPSIQTPAASKQSSGIGALLLTLGLVYLGLS